MSYKLIESTQQPSFKRFVQRSFGLDLIKGLGITLKEFFTPQTIATIKYPLEKIPLSPRYRAIHKLMRLLESGEERCIGCGLCEKICISNCIKIETGYGEDGRKKIESYTINFGRCIYCGFCAEVCPEIAIIHGERYENVSEQRAHFANKSAMLTPLDLALRGNIDEFAGFGSLREEADECVKMTPTDYVTKNAESTLDSANSQNLVKNNPSLRADSQNLRGNPPIKKTQDLQGGLPHEQSSLAMTKNNNFAESARNDEILDSSLRLRSAQNDNVGLDSAASQNLVKNNPSLRADSQNLRGNPPIEKSQNLQNGLPRSHSLARNDEVLDSSVVSLPQNDKVRVDSVNSQNLGENNAKTAESNENSLDSAPPKREREKSPQDEFAPQKDKLC